MSRHIAAAREAVQSAAELAADSTVHEQLNSVDRGLAQVSDGGASAPDDDVAQGDRLQELEETLVGLGEEAESDLVLDHVETARDHVDAYRREDAPDWEG